MGDRLVAAILDFVGADDLLTRDEIREQLAREVDAAGPAALLDLRARLSEDRGWTYYPPDPLAQRIHHLLADRFLRADSSVTGLRNLAGVGDGPIVICANHLSYSDANVLEVLLHRAGAGTLANRLTALAGPKVFTSRQRRFSSLCFGTVKVPQSTDVSSGEAQLNARDVARAARQSIEVALDRLDCGDALILFGEGTRSRSAAMQPMLPAVSRYLEPPGTWLVPIALTGTETMFPIGEAALRAARVVVRIGVPARAASLFEREHGDRRRVVDNIGRAIADLLPASYRGAYSDPDPRSLFPGP
jgi:1-acyl-sn-glycerol-3-phosphate acyltransferase